MLKILLLPILFPLFLIAQANHYFFDSDQIRYELRKTSGDLPYNWLFLPGGPGLDSSYLRELVDELKLPGNIWLIDFPGNGTNQSKNFSENFDEWFDLFPKIVNHFYHPILVGHSFGGMLPLLFPQLESHLGGLVILNCSPVLHAKEADLYSQQFKLPDITKEMEEFSQHPNQKTFTTALRACMPYYFPKETLEKGRTLFSQTYFSWKPAAWWKQKAVELNFSAKWIPQELPTLIIGGKYDCICPFTLFQQDQRFARPNIQLLLLEKGGHFPWIEDLASIQDAFEQFITELPT